MFSTSYAQLAKRIPSFLYKIGAQLYIDRVYPRHLFIETTANCNLSCQYCPREQNSQNMDFNLFRKIVDEATGFGPRSFSLHLFGEPLLYPRIFEAVRYIKQRNKAHTVLLTTNGTRLNSCIDDFVSCGIDQAYWTWRTEARFRESTVLKLRKWGKFRVRFIEGITTEEGYKQWEDWPNQEGRRMHNYGSNILLSDFGVKDTIDGKRHPCYHLWLAPAISWNGNLLLCCADPHQKEVIGNLAEKTVKEMWSGTMLEKVRNSHLSGEYEGICKNCDVWKEYPDIFFKWQKVNGI